MYVSAHDSVLALRISVGTLAGNTLYTPHEKRC